MRFIILAGLGFYLCSCGTGQCENRAYVISQSQVDAELQDNSSSEDPEVSLNADSK